MKEERKREGGKEERERGRERGEGERGRESGKSPKQAIVHSLGNHHQKCYEVF